MDELALWQSVIEQAIRDLVRPNNCGKQEVRKIKDDARRWIFSNSSDLYEVCDRANMHPDYVRKLARGALINTNFLYTCRN